MADDLTCPRCGRPCTSKSGLTLHLKNCEVPMSDANTFEPEEYEDPRDVDPRDVGIDPRSRRNPDSGRRPVKSQPSSSVLQTGGAFNILDGILLTVDRNFAAALGDYILTNGSQNRAILAFGHKLVKIRE